MSIFGGIQKAGEEVGKLVARIEEKGGDLEVELRDIRDAAEEFRFEIEARLPDIEAGLRTAHAEARAIFEANEAEIRDALERAGESRFVAEGKDLVDSTLDRLKDFGDGVGAYFDEQFG